MWLPLKVWKTGEITGVPVGIDLQLTPIRTQSYLEMVETNLTEKATESHKSEYTPHISANILLNLFMGQH